jgi:ubiquinone/menaquinone biosynthesis C-methylase UbiE
MDTKPPEPLVHKAFRPLPSDNPAHPGCSRNAGTSILSLFRGSALTKARFNQGPPDRDFALATYAKLARNYDDSCHRVEPVRRLTIALLALKPGDTAFDVASGTGLSLPLLAAQVGASGRVVAIEQSPEMAEQGRRRGLANVEHVVAPVETAALRCQADAVLFHYTHDVVRNPAALAHLFAHVKPGARVAIAGFKLPTGWRALFNPWHRHRTRGYLSTLEGVRQPWSILAGYVPDLTFVAEPFLGSGYVGAGRFAGARHSRAK